MFKGWVIAVGLAVFLGGCGVQSDIRLETADYDPEHDVYVVFQGQHFEDAGGFVPVALIGDAAFELQEGTHASIRSLGIAELDYYYIWLCLGRACIPVDPVRPHISK